MKLRFTRRALADLEAIAGYLVERDSLAAERVEKDIMDTLQSITDYPSIGRRQIPMDVRKMVTARYAYIIYYQTNEALGEIAVLTIQHARQERPFEDD